MAAEFAHHAVSVAFGMLLDGRAHVAQKSTGAYRPDAEPHAFVGGLAQALRLNRRFVNVEHAAGIAVKTVFDHGDVNVQNVPGSQYTLPGNAVADLVVDRSADRLRKRLVAGWRVVQRGRDGLLFLND